MSLCKCRFPAAFPAIRTPVIADCMSARAFLHKCYCGGFCGVARIATRVNGSEAVCLGHGRFHEAARIC